MNLYSGAGIGQGPGMCCRQSRLRGVVGGLFMCAFLVGLVLLLRHRGAPRLMWIGGAVMSALVVPVVLHTVLARFRPTNWVLRIDSDGLWINLRPLQTRPADGVATAVHLSDAEIARVHRHIDTWSTPSTHSGSTQWKQESLDLHLASVNTQELSLALAEARASGKGAPVSVTVPASSVIRIAWRGHGHDVVPALGRVLAEIGQRVAVADPTRTDRPDWRELSGAAPG